MARISPFRPYRYTTKAGQLGDLVTQPYDKITRQMRSRYLALSPFNLVRVILGEPSESDSESENVYTRAAAHLEQWIRQGILERDGEPSLYAYFQHFREPDTGEFLTRQGFVGLGAVEDYSAGVVHRHEQTLSGPKKDRLELLRHTRVHAGQIFMLYPDPACEVDDLLMQAAAAAPPCEVEDEYGTLHQLWRIADPQRITRIQELMRSKKLLIADGHHRYETALAFRDENPTLKGAADVMMTFVNTHSPGLKILATHRLVSGLEDFDEQRFLEKACARFRVTRVDSLEALRSAWRGTGNGRVALGAAIDRRLYVFERTEPDSRLDVEVLHQDLLEDNLSIGGDAIREERNLRYIRGLEPAVEQALSGVAQIAFLLRPVSVNEVARIAFAGGVMPQKSTDFYPKLLSGLTIYRIEE